MIKYLNALLLLLIVTFSYSQRKSNLDSLRSLIARSKQDTGKVNLMFTLGIALEEEQPKEALKVYKQAADLSRKIKSPRKEYSSLINQGIANFHLGKWDSAIFAYNQALVIAKNLGLKEKIGIAYVDIGNVHLNLNQYPEAIEFYQLAEPNLSLSKRGVMYANMIDIFNKIGRYKEMLEYGYKAIQLNEESRDTASWLDAHINMFSEKNDTLQKEGFHLMKKILPVALKRNDKYRLQAIYHNMAIYYYHVPKKYDSALLEANRCEELKRVDNAQSGLIDIYSLKSRIYLMKKDFASAKKFGLMALSLAPKKGLVTHWREIYYSLAEAEEGLHNYSSAIGYFEKYIVYRDSTESLHNAELSGQLDARYQSEKKEREINLLERQQAKQAEEINFRNLLIQAAAIALVLLLIIGFLYFRNAQARERVAEQQKEIQKQKIAELEKDKQLVITEAIVKGQEEERSRLAKDLHDGLGGILWGVKSSLSTMKGNMILSGDNVQAFERSLDMLDNSILELRRVAHNLMPEALVKFGLASALKDFCDFVNSSKVVEVIFQSVGNERRLDLAIEVVLYRVANELVNNALKHASAKEIIIQLNYDDHQLTMTVEDNGVGFDKSVLEKTTGAGWPNIKSRIAYLKGSIDIETSVGNGTAINVTIPI